ncbi:unnamed protein product [Pedinophyceae sp. YPF-701]|nr:unnamed protein product [Pedinophyceae sp. YPF-701]
MSAQGGGSAPPSAPPSHSGDDSSASVDLGPDDTHSDVDMDGADSDSSADDSDVGGPDMLDLAQVFGNAVPPHAVEMASALGLLGAPDAGDALEFGSEEDDSEFEDDDLVEALHPIAVEEMREHKRGAGPAEEGQAAIDACAENARLFLREDLGAARDRASGAPGARPAAGACVELPIGCANAHFQTADCLCALPAGAHGRPAGVDLILTVAHQEEEIEGEPGDVAMIPDMRLYEVDWSAAAHAEPQADPASHLYTSPPVSLKSSPRDGDCKVSRLSRYAQLLYPDEGAESPANGSPAVASGGKELPPGAGGGGQLPGRQWSSKMACRELSSRNTSIFPYSIATDSRGSAVAIAGDDGMVEVLSIVATPDQAGGPPKLALQDLAFIILGQNVMANCVRFGKLLGKERMIVTAQVLDRGLVYVFEVPEPAALAGGRAPTFGQATALATAMRSRVHEDERWDASTPPAAASDPGNQGRMALPVLFGFMASSHVGAEVEATRIPITTSVIGQFGREINAAVPCPAGHELAVVSDAAAVWVLNATDGFNLLAPQNSNKLFSWRGLQALAGRGDPKYAGCQYCAWSADGALLALSLDGYRSVLVWSARTRHFIACVPRDCPVPTRCLPVAWSTANPNVLIFAERTHRLWMADVTVAAKTLAPLPLGDAEGGLEGGASNTGCTVACIDLPAATRGHDHTTVHSVVARALQNHCPHVIVCGLAATPSGHILVGFRDRAVGVAPVEVTGWSCEAHRQWPQRFKDVARMVMAARPTDPDARGAGMWSLPRDVLLKVVEHAAGRGPLAWTS